jgi:hypothetical protein
MRFISSVIEDLWLGKEQLLNRLGPEFALTARASNALRNGGPAWGILGFPGRMFAVRVLKGQGEGA